MSDHQLRWQLRQLPRELEPRRDLWPGIASQLPANNSARSRRWPWIAGLALAASLSLAIGLGWRQMEPEISTQDSLRAQLVQREADAMTREYRAAMRHFSGAPMPEPLLPTLLSLDQSAIDIRQAIADDPQSAFLLQQLQRTYARRLTLTQRAVTG